MLLWPRLVCGSTAKVTWSTSSQAIWAPAALLVSPFNVKWRFSAPAGGVEGSKLCPFSVIMPAKCVSGVSPRFHYRRLAFCFLPLAAILESSHPTISEKKIPHFYKLISIVNSVFKSKWNQKALFWKQHNIPAREMEVLKGDKKYL
jgi:hypothetical protein